MSECVRRETLLAFADRELATDEMKLVERHIADCSACKREFDNVSATSLKVDALLSSLVPSGALDSEPSVFVSIPQRAATIRTRWAAVGSIGLLAAAAFLWFLAVRGSRPTQQPRLVVSAPPVVLPVEKAPVAVPVSNKPTQVAIHKPRAVARQFQALDNGGPIQTGMIYRVSMPAPSDSARRIPAEVIVDDFGKVRAIRFLQ
jgi:anti-sigma factor RsiW